MPYNKPFVERIETDTLCDYGCNNVANYYFRNEKFCCSKHYNSCPGKKAQFSERTDHKARCDKSLETRTRLGITKSSQVKGGKTRKESGHYDRLADKMKDHWLEHPWNVGAGRANWRNYKETDILCQGSYEYAFIASLEAKHGLLWVKDNVERGPCLKYFDPTTQKERVYVSDFLIGNTVYEIKSEYSWDNKGNNPDLLATNMAKLQAAVSEGYMVILLKEFKEEIINE